MGRKISPVSFGHGQNPILGRRLKGNWVFNAATIYWSIGLATPPGFVLPWSHWARPHGADERVQRITANFFAKCGVRPARE